MSSRIIQWQDRLNEYDFEVHHRPGKSHLMGIADRLSQMPTRYMTIPKAIDAEWIALPAIRESQPTNDPHEVYRVSKEYGDIMDYLQHKILLLKKKGFGTNQIKNTYRRVHNFQLTTQGLLKHEKNGSWACCILLLEIPAILKDMHDGCSHFADAITLDRIVEISSGPRELGT